MKPSVNGRPCMGVSKSDVAWVMRWRRGQGRGPKHEAKIGMGVHQARRMSLSLGHLGGNKETTRASCTLAHTRTRTQQQHSTAQDHQTTAQQAHHGAAAIKSSTDLRCSAVFTSTHTRREKQNFQSRSKYAPCVCITKSRDHIIPWSIYVKFPPSLRLVLLPEWTGYEPYDRSHLRL
jgi:hypothetical protein